MRKFLLPVLLFTFFSLKLFAQGTETFTNIPAASASYAIQNWTGDNGLAWVATDARTDQTLNTSKAICIRVGSITCNSIANGVGSITFKHVQVFSGTNPVLEVKINGNLIATVNPTTTVQTVSLTNINISGSFNLEIKQITSGLRVVIDDITWTSYSGAACTTPTAQPTSLTFPTITNTSIAGSFVAASPAPSEYLIIRSTSSTLNILPTNGTNYATDDVIGNGVVVDRGNITSFTANTLAAGTTYYFFIFSVNSSCAGGPLYLTTSPLTNNATTTSPPVCSTPTSGAGSLSLTAASTTINAIFAAATGADGYLVIRSSSSTLGATPTNGTSYTVGNTFGSGTIIKFGSGNTFSATGLTQNTTYYFYVFAVSNFTCTGGPMYFSTSTNGNSTTTTSSTGEPTGYYATATGLTCGSLKTALKTIITNGNSPNSYSELWTQYTSSDIKPREVGTGSANVIWDIYSDNPTGVDPYNFTPASDQCGSYSSEGICYNREHSFPLNWFNGNTGSAGAATDYHHIFPTDGKVNGMRSNFIYGEVATASFTSQNGGKLGSSAIAGFTGNVFEPITTYKGDLARAFLYMVTRYEDNMPTWGNITGSNGLQALEPNIFPSIDIAYLKLMIKWHNLDPVSQKEIDRNNAAYSYQGNRNPFVDHPEYVNAVWNSSCPGLGALPVNIIFFAGKLQANKILLTWDVANEINFDRYEIERSFNGTNYTTIGITKAVGNKNYTYTDNADNINGRRVYYRLKKVDADGSYTYSDVFTIHIPLNVKFSVYPNPATNFIHVNINGLITENFAIQITDIAGKIVYTNNFNTANNVLDIATNKFANGTFIVKLISNNAVFTQKVVVAK